MALHFATLALLTGTCPLNDIFVDAGPHIPSSEETLSCADAWMRKRVPGIKNCTSEVCRDEGAGHTCEYYGGIGGRNGDRLKDER